MASKFYVVWAGKQTGIFTDWDTCKAQVQGVAGAKYKSFKTRAEAEAAFGAGAKASLGKDKAAPRPAARRFKTGPVTHTAAEVDAHPAHTKIFADGGCDPNPGPAASGLSVYRAGELQELRFGLFHPRGTNNTAELNALHQALLLAGEEVAAGRSVAVFCDSTYSIQCITQWAWNWERKGWTKPGGEIKNLELIQQIFALYKRLRDDVPILHVNGHVGVEGNELADRMSIHGMETAQADFVSFDGPLDKKQILAMRAG